MRPSLLFAIATAVLTSCTGAITTPQKPSTKPALPVLEPLPTAPDQPGPVHSGSFVIRNATVWTAAGAPLAPGFVHVVDGRIAAVGAGSGPADATSIVDAAGGFVTPGIIDTHSHMGVYSMPYSTGLSDGNEAVGPTTPQVWAEHGFWPQDPSLGRALAGGVTTIQVLPGSANLIGGRSFVARTVSRTSARMMRFPGAPQGMKMACGENPKRVYGDKGGPQTRMGNIAGMRAVFQQAHAYRRSLRRYTRDLEHWRTQQEEAQSGAADAEGDASSGASQEADGDIESKGDESNEDPPEPPTRDFAMETLVGVLDGDILVHVHCYRADEMHIILDLAKEFGFKVRSFHHALEAYKLANRLAAENVAASTWADWWGFKMEAYDGIPHNAAMLSAAHGRAIIHSDDPVEARRLNQEAAKARRAGRQLGLAIDDNETLRWITANPAWALGIEDEVGTLEVGKRADIVIWDGSPFSVYSKPTTVFVDGITAYDRTIHGGHIPSDFELGHEPATPPQLQRSGGRR